jgi:carbamoyltransferase
VGNGRILREGLFKNIWIQPAAGDAGGALGAALCVWYGYLDKPRLTDEKHDLQSASLLGPEYKEEEVLAALKDLGAVSHKLPDAEMFNKVADLIVEEQVIGWFQGRMEFGPRALGGRSILGDPRSPHMQSKMNLKIKFRESFRPFAPTIMREHVSDYFDMDCDSPYMLLVAPVKEQRRIKMTAEQEKLFGISKLNVPRSDIPAITHVDYSARIQTVTAEENPRFYRLLRAFKEKTGCPLLVNTSFNVRGEPIVCTPQDAYICFMRTEIDCLVINNFLLYKEEQPKWQEKEDWRKKYELD